MIVDVKHEDLSNKLKDVNDRVGDFLQTGGGPITNFFGNIAFCPRMTVDKLARLQGPEALPLYVSRRKRSGVRLQ